MGFGSKKRKRKRKKKTGNRAGSEGRVFLVCFVLFLLPKPTKMLATSTVPLEKTMIFLIRFFKGWDACLKLRCMAVLYWQDPCNKETRACRVGAEWAIA